MSKIDRLFYFLLRLAYQRNNRKCKKNDNCARKENLGSRHKLGCNSINARILKLNSLGCVNGISYRRSDYHWDKHAGNHS